MFYDQDHLDRKSQALFCCFWALCIQSDSDEGQELRRGEDWDIEMISSYKTIRGISHPGGGNVPSKAKSKQIFILTNDSTKWFLSFIHSVWVDGKHALDPLSIGPLSSPSLSNGHNLLSSLSSYETCSSISLHLIPSNHDSIFTQQRDYRPEQMRGSTQPSRNMDPQSSADRELGTTLC